MGDDAGNRVPPSKRLPPLVPPLLPLPPPEEPPPVPEEGEAPVVAAAPVDEPRGDVLEQPTPAHATASARHANPGVFTLRCYRPRTPSGKRSSAKPGPRFFEIGDEGLELN